MAAPTELPGTADWSRRPRWSIAAAISLLALHALLAFDTLRQKSVTVDEVGHLPAGLTYLQKRTFTLYHHNPPLVKLMAAAAVLAADPAVDYSKSWKFNQQSGLPPSPWAFGWEFMDANAARYQELYICGRLAVLLLSLAAGVVIFLWSSELFGAAAGILSLALWSFCPNAIAHAGMVTTDMGATSLGFVATFCFWRYLKVPTWGRAWLAGLALGAAELAKFSSLVLYLLWPCLWCVWWARSARTSRPAAAAFPQLVAICLVSVAVINAGYFFEGTGTPLGSFQFLSRSLTRPRTVPIAVAPGHPWQEVLQSRQNRFAGTWLHGIPVPLPRHYVEGFDEQKLESEGINGQGYPVYLRGELRRTGWWWYYLYALAVKVPLGTWLLTGLAVAGAWSRPAARANPLDEFTLAAPIATTLFVMTFLTDINLGLRYVLPIFPFWFVLLGRLAVLLGSTRPMAVLASIGFGWNLVWTAWIHPHHLAFFNELAGGPRNGYRHLIDSNLDWGQDLLLLEQWLRKHRPGEPVSLAYFGNVDPSILAQSGRPLHFALANPKQLDHLKLVATRPDGALAQARYAWATQHARELEGWIERRRQMGLPVVINDHPEIRNIALRQVELSEGIKPGLHAISANFVAGLPFRLRDQHGNIWNAEEHAYSHFQQWTPIAQIGYSIFVYDIPGTPP